jgi:hypothetical protein
MYFQLSDAITQVRCALVVSRPRALLMLVLAWARGLSTLELITARRWQKIRGKGAIVCDDAAHVDLDAWLEASNAINPQDGRRTIEPRRAMTTTTRIPTGTITYQRATFVGTAVPPEPEPKTVNVRIELTPELEAQLEAQRELATISAGYERVKSVIRTHSTLQLKLRAASLDKTMPNQDDYKLAAARYARMRKEGLLWRLTEAQYLNNLQMIWITWDGPPAAEVETRVDR